jgi:branched-chain amino acid transport system permease protein
MRRLALGFEVRDVAASLSAPLVLTLLATGFVAAFDDNVMTRIGVNMLINLILVVGLYLFVGNSGVLSFGHISFMAVGAYTSAIVSIPAPMKHFLLPHLPGFLERAQVGPVGAALLAAGVSAIVGLALSIPLMRLAGLLAAIATLAVLEITQVVASNWDAVTRGTGGMFAVPTDSSLLGCLAWASIAIGVAFAYQSSGSGLRLRASRESDTAAAAVGINITRDRVIAFTLSAAIVGVGGSLYAHFLGAFSPANFYFDPTFLTLAMLIVGGIGSLLGAVVGTIAVTIISEGFLRIEQSTGWSGLREVALAVVMLVILALRPRGLTGGREFPSLRLDDLRNLSLLRRRIAAERGGLEEEPHRDPGVHGHAADRRT